MKVRSRFVALLAILILSVLPLFAGTRIVYRWVLTGIPMPTIRKILIVGRTDNYLVRQDFEDKMEELLAKSGVTGIKSHVVFPPKNELMAIRKTRNLSGAARATPCWKKVSRNGQRLRPGLL